MTDRAMHYVDGLTKHDQILIGRISEFWSRLTCGRIKEGDEASYRNAKRSYSSISSRHLSSSKDFSLTYHPSRGMAGNKAAKIHQAWLIKLPYQTTHLVGLQCHHVGLFVF